jgi:hypothetical protein
MLVLGQADNWILGVGRARSQAIWLSLVGNQHHTSGLVDRLGEWCTRYSYCKQLDLDVHCDLT